MSVERQQLNRIDTSVGDKRGVMAVQTENKLSFFVEVEFIRQKQPRKHDRQIPSVLHGSVHKLWQPAFSNERK